MCLSRAIDSPKMPALDIWQIGELQDVLGSSTGTQQTTHIFWARKEPEESRQTQIIHICGNKPLQVDWESCMAGRGIHGEGKEDERSSRSGTETGIGTDSITQLLDDQCPSLEQEASQVCSCV